MCCRKLTLYCIANNILIEIIDGGSSLLCNPSPALQKLIARKDIHVPTSGSQELNDEECHSSLDLQNRPTMQFILQHHDLRSLKLAMRQASR